MVHFPASTARPLFDSWTVRQSSRLSGYPIRRSRDHGLSAPTPGFSQLATSFFVWVLLRLAAPRHPPWTLFRLTILLFQFLTLTISKTAVLCLEAWGFEPQTLGLQSRCSSQLSYAPGSRLDGQRKKERSLEAFSDNVLSCCARSL